MITMAAFVPQFEHDVFVSYAHLDNRPLVLGKDDSGWVSTLKGYLQNFLDTKLGRRANVWMDVKGLAGNEPLTPELVSTVSRSATLLVIFSHSYLESVWCGQERDRFVAAAGGELAAGGRVFVVHRDEIPRETWPDTFADLVGYQFYEKDELTGDTNTLGVPQPHPDEKAYHVRLNRLVSQLAQQLRQLKAEGQPTAPAVAAPALNAPVVDAPAAVAAPDIAATAPAIFLAEATNDLMDTRDELRTYLTQSGLRVLPTKFYSRTVSAFQEAMQHDLANCAVFVQLLGPYPPICTEELPAGYPISLKKFSVSGAGSDCRMTAARTARRTPNGTRRRRL